MAALRTPETGCPWDLQQDFASIAPYTIEEAYEVADAIERGDLIHLKDELGDLLLQVVFHARMAEERSAFDFGAWSRRSRRNSCAGIRMFSAMSAGLHWPRLKACGRGSRLRRSGERARRLRKACSAPCRLHSLP